METCKINLTVVFYLSLLVTFALAITGIAEKTPAKGSTTEQTPSKDYGRPPLRRVVRAIDDDGDGYGHYLPSRPPMTCDKFPKICRPAGSAGPDCCRKKCVNTKTDSQNCGRCGVRCGYGRACCGGKCVSIMYDRENCGGCGKRCKKGTYCRYGMCSYGY